MADPAALVRVCMTADGYLAVGVPGGRGAWLCRGSAPCTEAAIRRRAFDRALRRAPAAGALERLRAALAGEAGPGGAGPQVWEDGGSGRPGGARPSKKEQGT